MVPNNKVRTIITPLLIKKDLCNLPNLQEYLKIEKTATGKVFFRFTTFSGAEISRLIEKVEILLTMYKSQYRQVRNSPD